MEAHDPEAIDMLGARMLVVARMGQADGDTVLIRSKMDAGPRIVPLHAHGDIENFYVLEGRLDVYLDDDAPGWRTIAQGQSLNVAGNVRHAVRNSSGAPVDLILATTVRIARFFAEIGRPPTAGGHSEPSKEDIALVRRKAEEYGYWMASPAESAIVTEESGSHTQR